VVPTGPVNLQTERQFVNRDSPPRMSLSAFAQSETPPFAFGKPEG
jgi:hypothetical protein